MSSNQQTIAPSPWGVVIPAHAAEDWTIKDATGEDVARIGAFRGPTETEALAQLIAAAPTMRDRLASVVDGWQRHLSHTDMAGGVAAIEALLTSLNVGIAVGGKWSDE
jgi:hypothetical protein